MATEKGSLGDSAHHDQSPPGPSHSPSSCSRQPPSEPTASGTSRSTSALAPSSSLPPQSTQEQQHVTLEHNSQTLDALLSPRKEGKGTPFNKGTRIPLSDIPRVRRQQSTSSRFNDSSSALKLERIPPIKQHPPAQWQEVFLQKLRQCQVVFNFKDPMLDAPSKEIKREALQEINHYIASTKNALSADLYEPIFKMVEVNLFRPLCPFPNPSGLEFDPEEDDPVLEEGWLHLHHVYEFFARVLSSPELEIQVAKQFVTSAFVQKLVDLFDSEDPRERDYLKTIVHRIYLKFVPIRASTRKFLSNAFATFAYETGRHNGIAELLEIKGSVINGFQTPLKQEHKHFLFKVLMPLHTAKHITLYHKQLVYCVNEFLRKELTLAASLFEQLLRYWPIHGASKEIIFLEEMEELFSTLGNQGVRYLEPVKDLVFSRLSRCMDSMHFQVAEKAMDVFHNNGPFRLLLSLHINSDLPLFYKVLKKAAAEHWNGNIRGVALFVLARLKEATPSFFSMMEASDGTFGNRMAR